MWHCPYCGTPQVETARCWVCRRSSTTCSTCRHFRRAVTAGLGYCGLDRTRRPLSGTEIRGCWANPPVGATTSTPPPKPPPVRPARLRGFVPLDAVELGEPALGPAPPPREPAGSGPIAPAAVIDLRDRMTLFDLDP